MGRGCIGVFARDKSSLIALEWPPEPMAQRVAPQTKLQLIPDERRAAAPGRGHVPEEPTARSHDSDT